MQGNIHHAPLENPRRILDVGCGTGYVTKQLGRKYPDAEVVGVDLSKVPSNGEVPPNVRFVQGDIKELMFNPDGSSGNAIRPGGFDYIFSRLLIAVPMDWQEHIARLTTLLAPEGWIELHDLEGIRYNDRSGPQASAPKLWEELVRDCEKVNIHCCIGRYLTEYLSDQEGLEKVQGQRYKWLWAQDETYPQGAPLCHVQMQQMPMIVAHLLQASSAKLRSPEDYEEFRRKIMEYVNTQAEPGEYMPFYAAWARKQS